MYLFEEKVTPSFIQKTEEIAARLSVPVNWLMGVMELETAGTFSPSITNSLGYTGLIQFGKDAAERIGTTQAALRQMTAEQQLEYVYKYYVPYKSKIKNYYDLYIATLFPAALGKDLNYVLQTASTSAEKIANANPLFDINKDKQITVAEIETKLLQRIPSEFIALLKKKRQ